VRKTGTFPGSLGDLFVYVRKRGVWGEEVE